VTGILVAPFLSDFINFTLGKKGSYMENVNEQVLEWMLDMGFSENLSMMIWRVTVILAIFIIAFIVDKVCRRAIIPVIRKITTKTEFKWDDYLLGDDVLNNLCRLIPPVAI
jgi:miniconductance mechanosensitive channel